MSVNIRRVFSVVGTSFKPGATELLMRDLKPKHPLTLKREPNNKYDKNAIAVCYGRPLGYVPRGLAAEIAPLMDRGVVFRCAKASTNQDCVCILKCNDDKPKPPTSTTMPTQTRELIFDEGDHDGS